MADLIGIDWVAQARRDPYSGMFAGSGVTALVAEIDRLTGERDQARAERDEANAQCARALAAQSEAVRIMSEQSHRYGRLDQAVPSLRKRLRQALDYMLAPRMGAWPPPAWMESTEALLDGTADLDLSETTR